MQVPLWTDEHSHGVHGAATTPADSEGTRGQQRRVGGHMSHRRAQVHHPPSIPPPSLASTGSVLPPHRCTVTHAQAAFGHSVLPLPAASAMVWNRSLVCKDTWLVHPGGDQTRFSAKMRQKQWENQRGLVGRGLHCHVWEIKVSAPTLNTLLLCPGVCRRSRAMGHGGHGEGNLGATSLAHHRFAPGLQT